MDSAYAVLSRTLFPVVHSILPSDLDLNVTSSEKSDLAFYLKSLSEHRSSSKPSSNLADFEALYLKKIYKKNLVYF